MFMFSPSFPAVLGVYKIYVGYTVVDSTGTFNNTARLYSVPNNSMHHRPFHRPRSPHSVPAPVRAH